MINFGVTKTRDINNLIQILEQNIGSTINYSNIARDLDISPNTVKSYLNILEKLFLIYFIYPHSKNFGNSIRKAPKVYFTDHSICKDDGRLYENYIANQLFSYINYKKDFFGENYSVKFIRLKDKREIDFVLINEDEQRLIELIEVKHTFRGIPAQLNHICKKLMLPGKVLAKNIDIPVEKNNIKSIQGSIYMHSLFQDLPSNL